MIRIFRLVLILALSFGAVIAPDVSSAKVSDMAMTQMSTAEGADDRCDGCDPTEFADGTACEGGCPVPCGSGGTVGLVTQIHSAQHEIRFGVVVPVAEPLIPVGASPLLDPFPPKLPV